MFVLVRDEDVPTVAAAVTAYATEEGLEAAPTEAEPTHPLAMLAALGQPRALVFASDDGVVVSGLESLDIAEADEWGSRLSRVCQSEVVVLDVADDGVRVYVFDEGQREEEIEVPLSPSGRSASPALAEIVDGDDERQALEEGLLASSPDELAAGILRCFGVTEPGDDGVNLAFVDPLDAEGNAGDAEPPSLQVQPLAGAELAVRAGEPVVSPLGYVFAVSLVGVDSVEGIDLVLEGPALALLDVEAIEVALRIRGGQQRSVRAIAPARGESGALGVALTDAYLERVDLSATSLDLSDMFSSMQRLVGATEAQQLNTIFVGLRAVGVRAGEGPLVLAAAPRTAAAISPGEGVIALRVV